MLGFSLGLRPRPRFELGHRHEHRLSVGERRLSLRLSLIEELTGIQYKPQGECPACFCQLSAHEVIRGFNQDPADFTTRCPKCGNRFQPTLVCMTDSGSIELPFFCGVQTLAQLKEKSSFTPDRLLAEHPAIYRAAIVHYGGVRQAFEKIGITYLHYDKNGWEGKVGAFLGKMPDTEIAQCAGVSVSVIRRMRKKAGVAAFSKSN